MIYIAESSEKNLDPSFISEQLDIMISRLGRLNRILLLPPDFTRNLSFAGEITCMIYEKLKDISYIEIMPALGTHAPMTAEEIASMYPGIPLKLFRVHNWQKDVEKVGTIEPLKTRELTGDLVDWEVDCEINRKLIYGNWDQVISIGQLMPHELVGIANYNKNILVGVGGKDVIGKTHITGALYGQERMMGHVDSPVRNLFNYMSDNYLKEIPITYVMTVRGEDAEGRPVTRGLFAGNDEECYRLGAKLCQNVNIKLLDKEYNKIIAYLSPDEIKSVWIGNKAICRTRMAIADGGVLVVLCPGIRSFGENYVSDSFIRKYGYLEKESLLDVVKRNGDFDNNMASLSHMIISSPEGRFKVIHAVSKLNREELESVNCNHAIYEEVVKKYDPFSLKEGENIMPDGEEVYFVSKPTQGLWAERKKFMKYPK